MGPVVHRHCEFETFGSGSEEVHGVDVHAGIGQSAGHRRHRTRAMGEHRRDHAALFEDHAVMLEQSTGGCFVIDDELDGSRLVHPDGYERLDVDSDGGEAFGQVGQRSRPVRKVDRELRHVPMLRRSVGWGAVLVLLLAACSDSTKSSADGCAEVIAVDATVGADGTTTFSVTIRSDDIGWDGYADRWEVVEGDEVIGERVLTHPHVEEQPFTRSQSGIVVHADEVVVRAHHSVGDFCGAEMLVPID